MKRPASLLRSLTVGLVLVGLLAGLASWQVPAPSAGAASGQVGALQSTAAAGAPQATAPPETTAAPPPTMPPVTAPPQPTAPAAQSVPVTAAAIQQVATVPAATQAATPPTTASLPGGPIAATGNDGQERDIPVTGADDSDPVWLGASIAYVSGDGQTDGIMVISGSGGAVAAVAVPPHDSVWYLAARPQA